MAGNTLSRRHKDAWDRLWRPRVDHPQDIFPNMRGRRLEDLKREYNEQFGYTIRIPQIDDIIHLVPDALKSDEQLKMERKQNLVRLLDSPVPDLVRSVTSVMGWLDNIQDTSAIIYPLLKLLLKLAPKAMGKALPVIGWITGLYDVMNLITGLGMLSLPKYSGKRALCGYNKYNPFTKMARVDRLNHIKGWKPNMADAIQAAQVLDQFTGMGLSMGPIIGTVFDAISGAYRYATGAPVKFTFDPPAPTQLDLLGSRGLHAASAISSYGQAFDEITHFWTYQTASLSLMAIGHNYMENRLSECIVDPMSIMLPAPRPTNPITIQVIKEAGLDLEAGIKWPYNGKKEISQGDLIDAQAEPCRAHFVSYFYRHKYDWYGFYAGSSMLWYLSRVFTALDPESDFQLDDTDEMKVMFRMVKAPILPARFVTEEEARQFGERIKQYTKYYGKTPGIIELERIFIALNIPYRLSYPNEPAPDADKYWPPGWTGEET